MLFQFTEERYEQLSCWAVSISDDVVVHPPTDTDWWNGYRSFTEPRYDTPRAEKSSAREQILPLFLSLRGEVVFHYFNAQERAEKHLVKHLPSGHHYRTEEDKRLFFATYGGDYWLNAVFSNVAFWRGLHKAGSRGTFVLEVGCEHSIDFNGYEYSLYSAAWPAWYLLIASLSDECTLEKVYPDPAIIEPHKYNDGEGCESGLHFFCKHEGEMMHIARTSPFREKITLDSATSSQEYWQI